MLRGPLGSVLGGGRPKRSSPSMFVEMGNKPTGVLIALLKVGLAVKEVHRQTHPDILLVSIGMCDLLLGVCYRSPNSVSQINIFDDLA